MFYRDELAVPSRDVPDVFDRDDATHGAANLREVAGMDEEKIRAALMLLTAEELRLLYHATWLEVSGRFR